MMMNKSKALRVLHGNMRIAERILKQQGELMPMFVFHCRDGNVLPCGAPLPENVKERDMTLNLVRTIGVAHDAVAMAMVHEVWMATAGPDYNPETDLRPSEREDKREYVMVMVEWRDEPTSTVRRIHTAREIERGEDAKITGLTGGKVIEDQADGHEMRGRMVNMIPPKRPDAAAIATAHELLKAFADRVHNADELH